MAGGGSTARRGLSPASLFCLPLLLVALLVAFGALTATAQAAPCDEPVANEILCENTKPGSPASEWDVAGAGSPGIQGFATDISVDLGDTVDFKVDTDADDYRLDIYRMGFYGGDGARLVASVEPSAALPQSQPSCLEESSTGLIDCGNWAVSASWDVPADAVSGIYFGKLVREDATPGSSHIYFVVRDDDGGSDLLFQTGDTTWQAYNQYGGNSLYTGSPAGRAYKVSYNRPFTVRGPTPEDSPFNAEYPMVRWLERNGYDVSYFTGVDSDRFGAEILEHEAFLSVGHDEYWSAGQRANVTAARDAGVDLAFFSGNEIFWKTRWENSIDGSGTSHRTLVTYKETHAGAKIDPTSTWTGTWRDVRPFNPEGPQPENALTGTIFTVNSGTSSIEVQAAEGDLRLWRNTNLDSLAPGQSATLGENTLGYEWDEDLDNGSRPPGLIRLSTAVRSGVEKLQDNGSTYAPGTATHHLTMYRAPSGALVFGAGTIQWSWGLDGEHDRGTTTPDQRMQQATVNLLADMAVQPDGLQPGLTAATASTDTAAPSSTVTDPASGAEVQARQTTITGTATDADGEVGGVEVSIDGGAWHPAEGRGNWSYSWTPEATGPATIQTRAVDDSGNIESPGPGTTVEVVPASCPCSIWSDSVTPPLDSDTGAVELGVKFRADVDGEITALRFYKGPANTGTHVGHLWTASGTLLAQATFTGESATGWQEVQLDSPVAIEADTTYVASYHAPNGGYAATVGAFSGQGADAPPLHALADGVDGANGVYNYGPAGVFPTQTFNATNYWVDVVFDDETGPDTTPPGISLVAPAQGSSGIGTSTNVTATFSEAMDAATINDTSFELRDDSGAIVPAAVTYSAATRTATLDPNADLAHSSTYTATVKGGPGGVTDVAGNPRGSDHSWSFTTAAAPPPPPDEGPGGPILVIGNAADPFSRYYAEILRAEGLNEFNVTDLSGVDAVMLDSYDVVILGATALSPGQAQTLSDWVTAGGNLIAMRPDADLAGLLGISPAGSPLSEGYLQVEAGSGPGAGIVDETMQFHGAADLYTATGADTIATLYSDATTATSNPAVTLRSVGANGGQAAAFTYDLARSIVYTRQGNPAWAGQSRDGQAGPIRADNLFFGDAATDPQPDWVDRDKIAIPQADEQQRLLANLIGEMNVDRMPLPRFWYFPRSEKAVVVMTGDDHAGGGTAGRFDQLKALSPNGCSVADWECLRSTSYVYPNSPLTNAQAVGYEADGFEVALHLSTGCANFTPTSLEQNLTDQLGQFAAEYPGVPAPATNRTHCIAWSDWATVPKTELNHGIRFDTNYYYWPPEWVDDTPGLFTGSGMPMRFADTDGSMIDVYQAATQMTDESGQSYPFTANALLDRALGTEGYYGAFVANMHTDSASSSGSDAIIASAQARDVPVVSSEQMLRWLDGRNGSSFDGLAWNGDQLEFSIEVGAGANGLQAMVPTRSAVGELTEVTRNGAPVATTAQTIKGQRYAFLDAAPGDYAATYEPDQSGPAISNVAESLGPDTATITWDTDEPSDSRVDYGTSPGSLGSSESDAGMGTSHSIGLSGLDPNTTYYYRVTSTDAAANATTEPGGTQPPRSFTTPAATLTDTTVADFSAGTPDPDGYVSDTGDGEVMLEPTVGAEFAGGPGLPGGWSSSTWESQGGGAGGSTVLAGGRLEVDGAFAGTDASFGPGRSLEFSSTFGGAPFQHVGLTDDFTSAWALISTAGTSNQLYARTNTGSGSVDTPIPGALIGSEHRYRIEWVAGEVRYYVDGSLVATHTATFGPALSAAASDFNSGGPDLSVDWIRLSPFPASSSFDSRVLDAGEPVNWQALSWTADTPAGTGVALQVRTGSTPVPDASWSSFAPVAASGGAIGGHSRYLQYRAVLDSGDAMRSPSLSEVSATYATGGDTTAPTIATRTPAPGATGVDRAANVEVGFSEPMNPATIDASTVRLREQGGGADVTATVGYAGATATLNPDADLEPGTTYEVTVAGSVEDQNGNPLGTDDTWTFTTAGLSLIDTTSSDFGAGATGPDTYVARTADGEVTLRPTEGAEFEGASLPAGWSSAPWSPGGGATVSGGSLQVDGASAGTTATYGAARSLEFAATFTAAPFQTAGFATDLNAPPWAVFSTKADSQLYARTHNGSVSTETPLPASLFGSQHRYRIEWDPGEVRFFVDDALVATHSVGFAQAMRPLTSDFNPGGPGLTLDWLRMSPYPASGSFDSRILDAGENANWGALAWDATAPAGTDVEISVRTGNTPTPDGSWSGFDPIASSGGDVPGASRYVQYRARLLSSDPARTAALSQVSIGYAPAPDGTPPTISQRSPAPDATGVDAGSNVVVGFSEAVDPATVDGSSVRLRKRGSGADVPASVNAVGGTVTLDPDASLDPGATYDVTVAGSIEDTSGNPLGADDTWKFTVGGPPVGLTDTTAADFAAGVPGSGAYVAETANGEVTLRPAVGEEFRGGPALPAGWSSANGPPWNGGSATVSGGSLHVDGAVASTDSTFGPGRVLEFEGVLGGASFQHAGLTADGFQSDLYAMFSTGSSSNEVRARTNFGGGESSFTVPGVSPDASHRYRIEWDTDEVRYFVDGNPVATHAGSFSVDLRQTVSDLSSGGPELALAWLRMGPYPASGSFDSRILDAGESTDWGALSWTAGVPAGTGIELSVRTGDTPTPDGSWSAFTPVASNGGQIPGNSRYVQYRAALTSSDPSRTPVLEQVAISGTEDIAPTAVDDEATVTQGDGPTPIDVLANDTDPDGGPLTIAVVIYSPSGAHGNVVVDPDNQGLTYEPDPGYCNSNPGDAPAIFSYGINGGSSATVSVRVECNDTTAPDTTITSGPGGPTNDPTPNFEFSADEGGASFECKVDGGSFEPCSSPETLDSLPDGNHTFSVRAVDGAGNPDPTPAERSFKVDTVAPVASVSCPPAPAPSSTSPVRCTASWSDPGGANASGVPFGGVVYGLDNDPGPGTNYVGRWYGGPFDVSGEGIWDLALIAVDRAANVSQFATVQIRIDTTAPDTTITSGPGGPTNDPTPTFEFSADEGGASFECKVDGGSFEPCSSPETLDSLPDGNHTFSVRAVDAAGNPDPTPATRTFKVDTVAPVASVSCPPAPAPSSTSPVRCTASWSDPGGANASGVPFGGVVYALDTDPGAGINYAGHWYGGPFDVSGEGIWDLALIAVDRAANVSQFATVQITIDFSPGSSTDVPQGSFRLPEARESLRRVLDGPIGELRAPFEPRLGANRRKVALHRSR